MHGILFLQAFGKKQEASIIQRCGTLYEFCRKRSFPIPPKNVPHALHRVSEYNWSIYVTRISRNHFQIEIVLLKSFFEISLEKIRGGTNDT
ncbi:hypothetical protein C8R42DRAFT_658949 [Lentinula raphanica]|nr:hypothetical protein C8R42DRAFT_658949 [Lentinula raphanica]